MQVNVGEDEYRTGEMQDNTVRRKYAGQEGCRTEKPTESERCRAVSKFVLIVLDLCFGISYSIPLLILVVHVFFAFYCAKM